MRLLIVLLTVALAAAVLGILALLEADPAGPWSLAIHVLTQTLTGPSAHAFAVLLGWTLALRTVVGITVVGTLIVIGRANCGDHYIRRPDRARRPGGTA